MLFSSFGYLLLFLPVVALVNAGLRRLAGPRAAQVWLLGASLFFYAFPRPSHLPLLLLSIVFNWAVARRIVAAEEPGPRKRWVQLGLGANVAFLASFKYVGFFLEQLGLLFGRRVVGPSWELPLGASFFTLTQVMALVDCYEGLSGALPLLDHATVVSFFPYVSSGPLVRVQDVAQQLRAARPPGAGASLVARGLYLLALGLFKKVVFADSFATVADLGWRSVGQLSTLEAWTTGFAYTFQIYFDFSGYSDMVVAAGWLLGYELPQNFKTPYASRSISEFWQRWHISLSSFITNYLYTPILRAMGKATLRTSAVATLLAMGIAGLWHGAGWTYVAFGLMHGAALAINQAWKKKKRRLPAGLGWALTFLFANAAFVVFRSPTLGAAGHMFAAMAPHGRALGTKVLGDVMPFSPTILARPLGVGVLAAFLLPSAWERATAFEPRVRNALATAAVFVVSFLYVNSSVAKRFVYFAF